MKKRIKLTKRAVDAIKPTAKETTIYDAEIAGFGLRTLPSGRKTFTFVYHPAGSRVMRRVTIGRYGAITTDEARQRAAELARSVTLGEDPANKQSDRKATSLAEATELYGQLHLAKRSERHRIETGRIFRRNLVPRLGGRPVAEIGRQDIRKITDPLAETAPAMALSVHRAASGLFSWLVDREYIEANPLAGAAKPTKQKARSRVLDDDELQTIWGAADCLGHPFGPLVRLLVVTGQRREEVGSATWDEFDLSRRLWTLPEVRTKNDEPHTVPLSDLAIEILEALPGDRTGYLFTTNGRSPVSGYSKAKLRLDRFVAQLNDGTNLQDWRLHDIRRGVASGMARLGLRPEVIEAALNHKTGRVSGLALTYNRYRYEAEKADALQLWAAHLKHVLGQSDNIVPLAHTASAPSSSPDGAARP